MATLERRYDKAGKLVSCRITVAGGMDSTGKQIRYRKNWKPPKEQCRQPKGRAWNSENIS